MRIQLVAIAIVGTTVACSTDADETEQAGPTDVNDAGHRRVYRLPDGAPLPENRRVTLTTWPIYESSMELAEGELPRSLDGVEVCVERARPWGGAPDDFVEFDDHCVTTAADENIVLSDLPARSELVVTAKKDGYWPSVFGMATGDRDTNPTLTAVPVAWLWMLPRSSAWPNVEPGLSDSSAALHVLALGCVVLNCAQLKGLRMSLQPDPGVAPMYLDGGLVVPDAIETVGAPGGDTFAAELIPENTPGSSGALFLDVPEGEYVVRLQHEVTACNVIGTLDGDTLYGWATANASEIKAPALPGHVTPALAAFCLCPASQGEPLDPLTCEPPLDGGAS